MSLAIFPAFLSASGWGLTYTIVRSPEWSTTIQEAPSGDEVRIQNYSQPLYNWQLLFDYLSNNNSLYKAPPSPYAAVTPYQEMQAFFNARGGMAGSFLLNDTDWNNLTTSPLQLITDGLGHWYSPVQCHYGGQTATDQLTGFFEDVTDLQPAGGADHSAITVFNNGSPMTYTTDYTLAGPGLSIPGGAFTGLYLAFTGTPSGPITITASYYYRVRFNMDKLDVEKFMSYLWTIGGGSAKNGSGSLMLKSARPPSV